jgi:histone deacetylase 1/2
MVLQCGADLLAGDKQSCFNITMHGHAHCVRFLRKQNIPLILLDGGGYTVKNVPRAWTYVLYLVEWSDTSRYAKVFTNLI